MKGYIMYLPTRPNKVNFTNGNFYVNDEMMVITEMVIDYDNGFSVSDGITTITVLKDNNNVSVHHWGQYYNLDMIGYVYSSMVKIDETLVKVIAE